MSKQPHLRIACRGSCGERGYALLFVVFLAAMVTIAAATAAPNLWMQGQREKEEELIWRGEQYARAVRLFYRKYGRFPTSLEDLTQAKNQIRFMRKTYADPMNREDGSWRLIYVGPAGQLIGSLTRTGALQLPGTQQRPASGQSRPDGVIGGVVGSGPTGGVVRVEPEQRGQQPQERPRPQATATTPSGPIIGGNIIGVGSKVNRPAIRVYNASTTYREWEFIWDPAKDAVVVGAPSAAPGKVPTTAPVPTRPPRGFTPRIRQP